MATGIWALVPFKGATGAKQRLGGVLDAAEREGLVLAMMRDVLATLTRCRTLSGVLLVSRDRMAFELAEEFGVDVFEDSATDLSGAVVQSGDYARDSRAAHGTLFVPGDVPLIRPDDVDAILDGHERVTLVPDANDIGTNAAASSPANAFEYLFDGKSRPSRRHRAEDRAAHGVGVGRGHGRRTHRRRSPRGRHEDGRVSRNQRDTGTPVPAPVTAPQWTSRRAAKHNPARPPCWRTPSPPDCAPSLCSPSP
ncbi:MAG: 2-phospho-L-lactate guanylyltransferase [Pseudomonadales bacterium]|nr:2-phospho-L-lactate guanylyltransferase [Pseudomonadales bacterium]